MLSGVLGVLHLLLQCVMCSDSSNGQNMVSFSVISVRGCRGRIAGDPASLACDNKSNGVTQSVRLQKMYCRWP